MMNTIRIFLLLSATLLAAATKANTDLLVNSIGMELVRINSGEFMMGQDDPQADYRMDRHPDKFDDANWYDVPKHRVTITTDFYIGSTEVTLGQYLEFNPDFNRHSGDKNEAVRFVSWYDAIEFCKWLSEKEGRHYRLPTEAEWEYACRGGTTTLFHTGDSLPDNFHKWFGNRFHRLHWFKDNKMPSEYSLQDSAVVLPVAKTPANQWGLYDMHGNVAEWCLDWYVPYTKEHKIDSLGGKDGDFRVVRGGSHSVFTRLLRSASRAAYLPDVENDQTGFRVVLGENPQGQLLSQEQSIEEDISQESPEIEKACPDTPFFSGPKEFVKIPDGSCGPLFSFHNHSPSISELPNGDLFAVWFSTVLEQTSELSNASSRLRYGSSEWEDALPFWDAPGVNDHAPKLWWDGDETIFHFASHIGGQMMRTSTNNGATWSKARIISPQEPEFGNRILRLQNGTLVHSSDDRQISLIYSQDNGETWTYNQNKTRYHGIDFRPGGQGCRFPGIHAAMVELADGRIMAMSRLNRAEDQEKFMFKTPVSYTDNLGETWTYGVTPFPAIGSTQRAAIIRLREGAIVFFSFTDLRQNFEDPIGMNFKASDGTEFTGYGLFGAVSYDDGITWPKRRLITPGGYDRTLRSTSQTTFTLGEKKAEPRGYLDAIQTRDGHIQLISSRNHYIMNLAWLEDLPDIQNKDDLKLKD